MSKERTEIILLLDEAIKLEKNVAKLYEKFLEDCEDFEFWWRLATEEKNHASLLEAGKKYFLDTFPAEILPESLMELKKANDRIESLINREKLPIRAEKFQIAIELENSAGELHFQKSMEMKSSNTILKLFQRLNKEDKDHAKRLCDYMEKEKIS